MVNQRIRAIRPSKIPQHIREVVSKNPEWKCQQCGRELCFDNYYGRYEGPYFHVAGYQCPSCLHASCKISGESGNERFNWRRLH